MSDPPGRVVRVDAYAGPHWIATATPRQPHGFTLRLRIHGRSYVNQVTVRTPLAARKLATFYGATRVLYEYDTSSPLIRRSPAMQ
jgi:hypothetical protein